MNIIPNFYIINPQFITKMISFIFLAKINNETLKMIIRIMIYGQNIFFFKKINYFNF